MTPAGGGRALRVAAGLVLACAGAWLVFSPLRVAAVLGRPHETSAQMINLRASWGGAALGLGAWVAWLPALRPWRRAALGLALWAMAGVGLARLVGFVLDGHPDTLQWVWLGAEALIVVGCAAALRRAG